MKKYIKYFSILAGGLLLGSALTACVDDVLPVDGQPDSSIYEIDEDKYGLGVTLSLSQLSGGGTRATLGDLGSAGLKDIEEYVNTDNLYILFFNLEGYFLFQIDKPVAIPIGQTDGRDSQWFIKIPVDEINENLIHYIEENPFKIAVLANWTYDADINTGGDWDEFEFHQPLDAEGNLTLDEYGNLTGDHISMLSHAELDKVYDNDKNAFDHLIYKTETGSHMGPYTQWVHNYHKSIVMAEQDIRYNFDVDKNKYNNSTASNKNDKYLGGFTMDYNNVWHLWNFKGNKENALENLPPMGEPQKSKWLALNETAKNEFLRNYSADNEFNNWKMNNYQDLEISYGVDIIRKPGDTEGTYDSEGLIIRYPNLTTKANEDGDPIILNPYPQYSGDMPHPYIHFKALADGYLRINYEATGGAKLYAHIGPNYTNETNSHYQRDNNKNREELIVGGSEGQGMFREVKFDPIDVYIYMVADSPQSSSPSQDPEESEGDDENNSSVPSTPVNPNPSVKIYSIEFIESRHIYDVDRYGILPSKEYPIPMYGIQDFDPIGEYWEPGVLFNLSQFNNAQKEGYNYRTISLLRSVSRVEVKLLKSAFKQKPSHVYIRSMNRSARITPIDFITPTDIIWNGFSSANPDDVKRLQNYIMTGNLREQEIMQSTPGVYGETQNIMDFGSVYIGDHQQSGSVMTEFRRVTAWHFGIWEPQWGWNWNRGDGIVEDFTSYKPGMNRLYTNQPVKDYPRIFHTRIDRSDYARMQEIDDPQYWHYIMYIPEKNIADANNPGDVSERPKMIHVELRFNGGPNAGNDIAKDEENQVDNFDDNAAYRLYFTEGGMATSSTFQYTGRGSWDDYEWDWNIVQKHRPIMRNHEYIFTVKGIPTYKDNVSFSAQSPDIRYGGWTFY